MTTTASAARVALGHGDRALVLRAAGGDHDAFDELAGSRIPAATRTAMAILRSEEDALDAVQEAFVAAWRELPRLREPDQFDAWLGRILVNRCRTMLRHRRVVRVREIGLEQADHRPGSPGQDGARAREHGVEGGQAQVADVDAIRRAFERLDADARALIVMHHVEVRPIAEIAALIGIPEGTVKWRLHAARKALEGHLERERR